MPKRASASSRRGRRRSDPARGRRAPHRRRQRRLDAAHPAGQVVQRLELRHQGRARRNEDPPHRAQRVAVVQAMLAIHDAQLDYASEPAIAMALFTYASQAVEFAGPARRPLLAHAARRAAQSTRPGSGRGRRARARPATTATATRCSPRRARMRRRRARLPRGRQAVRRLRRHRVACAVPRHGVMSFMSTRTGRCTSATSAPTRRRRPRR